MNRQEARKRSRSWRTIMAFAVLLVAAVSVFGVVAVLSVALVRTAWVAVSTLPAAVVAPTAVASLTVMVSVFSVLVTTQRSRASEIEKDHRRQKIPVYEEFLDFMFRVLLAGNTGREPPSEDEMIKFFSDFTGKITLWGGPELVKAWNEVRAMGPSSASDDGAVDTSMILAWERLLFAIREDIGHSTKGLDKGDILRLFINDLDEHLAKN